MIDMPSDAVIRKIIEQTDKDETAVKELIQEKLKQLSGLISEEGAAHIVANDLGVQLYKTEGTLKIKELSTAAKTTNTAGKVVAKYEIREFDKNGRKGKVANMMIGDETGRIRVVMWNNQTDLFEKINEGDIIKINNPYIKDNNGKLEVHLNDNSKVDINPAGLSIEVPEGMAETERPQRELKYLREIQGNEENVEVLGTILNVFDLRFFAVDPDTNKRVTDEDVAAGKPHTMNYVTTVVLDDGTAQMRVTCWKNQTQHLFGLSNEEILKWKDDPNLAAQAKHDLLGEIIKIIGRAKKNEQFERIELTASLVIKDVDPEKELARLKDKPAPETKPEEPKEVEAPKVESAAPAKESSPAPVAEPVTPTAEPATPAPAEEKTEAPAETTVEEATETAVEEKPAAEPASTTQEDREVKKEDVKFDTADEVKNLNAEEEVISIDDLEDI